MTNHMRNICTLFWVVIHTISQAQIDVKATTETKALYKNLFALRNRGIMMGHQDALAYGINENKTQWTESQNRSDIKTMTGEHPAVVGHDLGHLELNKEKNLDDVPFDDIKKTIQTVYSFGGINTISWHPNNPLDLSKTTWDKVDNTIPRILNNKKDLKSYKTILKKLATFFKGLKGANGERIPVIFRPYHEHTGSWFWWGSSHCTPDEYKEFWRMTVDYMIKKKKVHNLIYAYSTDNFRNEEHYLERYPGDAYVDLLGFDTYHRNAPLSDSSFMANAKRMVGTIKKLGIEKNKLFAITETGLEKVTEPEWWTKILYPIIEESTLSYVLVWRNGRPDHFYAPFKGHESEADFIRFYNKPATLFEKDVKNLYK